MISADDFSAFAITLRLAFVTTCILLLIGTPLAWWLARSQNKFKTVVEALVALPLVLPPTVLGFYLLLALGPAGPLGKFMTALGFQTLAFTFSGLVIGSVVYSLPFVVQPLQGAFIKLGNRPLEVAATLGANKVDTFLTVVLPMCRSGYLSAAVLGFAHTLGEFGVVLMIGGNIPGETHVLSIAIYDHYEALNFGNAHLLAGSLFILSFVMLLLVYGVNKQFTLVKV